jgi:predicted nicotinamide N-methyase
VTTDACGADEGAGYRVKTETVDVGDAPWRIRSLLDRQQFDDRNGAAERAGISSSAWPLFGLLWPSARVLAGSMCDRDVAGQRVLEVGCGLALPSLVLQRRGADVTASDCHPLAEAFLAHNARLNGLASPRFVDAQWARHDIGIGRYDLLIGSDVLYDREHPETLARFIDRHANARARLLIVDPNRHNRSAFTKLIVAQGFALVQTLVDQLPVSGAPYRGRLLAFDRV